MTQEQHPITPPDELVEQWSEEWAYMLQGQRPSYRSWIATQAARWGADMELDACCSWTEVYAECGGALRAARRPKLPSLKEQAFAELELLRGDLNAHGLGFDAPAIRRAIEALPD